MWRGLCRDDGCRAPLLYLDYQETAVCYSCGQEQLTNQLVYVIPYVESRFSYVPQNFELPPRSPELVKVHGMTNYHHKLISPLLTTQRVDKNARQSQQIGFLTSSGTLDCRMFGDKCFHLDISYIRVKGYGMDETAHGYLSDTLNFTKPFNNNRVTMVALQTDGDGHCLVHAVSRALIGTQLFWHPLRIGLLHHFNDHLDKYKTLLGMFIDNAEWGAIIEECDPEWKPTDGTMLGLRNVHIFGLANLLRRPIILLDCMAGINASADYAGVFLPGLNPPSECKTNGEPNPPIVLAWASTARNHYVPLVPFRDSPLPRYPRHLLPKVWAFPQNILYSYMEFDDQECLVIGSGCDVTDTYVGQLAPILDEQFLNLHGVLPALVSDLYYYHYTRKLCHERILLSHLTRKMSRRFLLRFGCFFVRRFSSMSRLNASLKKSFVISGSKSSGSMGRCVRVCTPKAEAMTEVAATMMKEQRLLRCLACRALCVIPINSQWLRPGGHLYDQAKKQFGGIFRLNHHYTFNNYGISCFYHEERDMLVISSHSLKTPCTFCQCAKLRLIEASGNIVYKNGDATFTTVEDINKCRCKCGFKHFWDGLEYDNPPIEIPVDITVYDKKVSDSIIWFKDETEEELNSTILDVAKKILLTHYRDKITDKELLESIVEQLEQVTANLTSSDHDVKAEVEAEEEVTERESRKREADGNLDMESPPTKCSPSEELLSQKMKCEEDEEEDVSHIRGTGQSYDNTSQRSVRSSLSDEIGSEEKHSMLTLIPVSKPVIDEPMDSTDKLSQSKNSQYSTLKGVCQTQQASTARDESRSNSELSSKTEMKTILPISPPAQDDDVPSTDEISSNKPSCIDINRPTDSGVSGIC